MEHEQDQPSQVQLSLFPDAFELQVAALSALRELEVPKARRLLESARRQNPRITNLALLDDALDLLEAALRSRPPRPTDLAQAWLAARDRRPVRRLDVEAAAFVEETIARYWKRHGRAGPFLDEAKRVHRAVLDLVLGDAASARLELEKSLSSEHRKRADLWAYLGDACLALDRAEEANACYVRALLLGAGDLDLARIRLRALAELDEGLRGKHDETCARELVLVHGWLEGLLAIPAENGWFDGQLSTLQVRARATPSSPAADRYRRFALLLYLDLSEPAGSVDLTRRREMAALGRSLFERFMEVRRKREQTN